MLLQFGLVLFANIGRRKMGGEFFGTLMHGHPRKWLLMLLLLLKCRIESLKNKLCIVGDGTTAVCLPVILTDSKKSRKDSRIDTLTNQSINRLLDRQSFQPL